MTAGKLLHTCMAVALTVTLGVYGQIIGHTWMVWVGAVFSTGFFAGREIAQAEYRWIERFGAGLRANMPLLAVFRTPSVWSEKSWLWDAALPCATAIAIAHFAPSWVPLVARGLQ